MLLARDKASDAEGGQQTSSSPEQPVGQNIRTLHNGRRCTCRFVLRILIIIGGVLTLLGVLMVLFYHDIFLAPLKAQLPLRRDSPTIGMFERPPADGRATFYFFNLTNPDEVTYYAERPILQEVGPYVYKLVDFKEGVTFNDDESEVSFMKRKRYEFDPDASAGDEMDLIMTLDFVAYGGFRGAHEKGQARLGSALLDSMNRGEPFKTYHIRDLLWGAHDPLFKVFLSVVPGETKPPIFGLMYGKNTTVDANFTVFTGKDNIDDLQKVKEYNGMSRLRDVWPVVTGIEEGSNDEYDANILRGTPGQTFAPGIDSETVLTVFAHDICFAINFTYRYDNYVRDISTLRFGVDFESHRKLTGAINQVLCDEESVSDRRCAMPGVVNVTKCRDGMPIVMSWPHFLDADYYKTLVIGLEPDEVRHGAFVDVDPLTGMTLNGARRIQINFPLMPLPYEKYKNLPKFTLYPVMWVEEGASISQDGIEKLNELVYGKYRILQYTSYATLIIGLATLSISILVYFVYAISCAHLLATSW